MMSATQGLLMTYLVLRGIPMPQVTDGSKVIEEANELVEAIESELYSEIKSEVADVVLAASVVAYKYGFTVEDALVYKINKDRGRG